MVYLAGRSQRGRARPLYCLVITLDRIRPGTAVGAPKSEPPAYASGSSVSGQLLVMCVLGACGVAGTVYGSCACEMGLLDALVIATCTITQITHVHICVICETDMARASGSERWWKMRTPPFCNLRTVRK